MPLCGVYSTSIHLYMVMSCHQGIPLKYETILHYLQCVLLIIQIKVPPARGKKLRRNAAAYGDASVRCKQFFCSTRSAVIVHKYFVCCWLVWRAIHCAQGHISLFVFCQCHFVRRAGVWELHVWRFAPIACLALRATVYRRFAPMVMGASRQF